jgi:ABC-type transport system involved in multi-copper enzyme maturation permease subunit
MHSILAIARVTLKDALRKKVLFVALLFAALLAVSSGFLPHVFAEEQVRQVSTVCLTGIGFFGMIVAVFLSAPSLPDDISKKTIFTVITKPARRWHVLAGKALGLGYVLGMLLAIMGSMSFIIIHVWAWRSAQKSGEPPRLDANRVTVASSVDHNGLTLELSQPIIESKRAIASGFDKITYHFTGLGGERFEGDTIFAQITLFSHSYALDPKTQEGTAAIDVTNPATGEVKKIVFGAETLRPKFLGFPRALVDKEGRLDITILRHLPIGSYSAMASSAAVLSQPSSYAMNFLKAMLMRFAQYMVLVFVATAASTFLTSTVSTVTALFIYFTGSLVELLRTQALSLGAGADIFTMAEHTHSATEHTITLATWLANMALRYFYLGVSVVFPNLDYFDFSHRITTNQYIENSRIFHGLVYAALYSAVVFAAGWLVFRRKEAE